jgi:hypothetical protein
MSDEYGVYGAIRKKLSSQNALLTLLHVALHCPRARLTSVHLSLHCTPSNNLGENFSDLAGGREDLYFWRGITW